jgi:hypothetical protein
MLLLRQLTLTEQAINDKPLLNNNLFNRQACPHKANCVPTVKYKHLLHSAFDIAYRQVWHRQFSPQGLRRRWVRQRMMEPVFANILQHYGLRRIGTKVELLPTKRYCSMRMPITSRNCSSISSSES